MVRLFFVFALILLLHVGTAVAQQYPRANATLPGALIVSTNGNAPSLYIHSTNGNIGIGTEAPPHRLSIEDGNLFLGNGGQLIMAEPGAPGSNVMIFRVPALTGDIIYTWPAAEGSPGQVLTAAAGGFLQWSFPSLAHAPLSSGTGIAPFVWDGSTAATVSLAPSGVQAGTYGASATQSSLTVPVFVVNAQGQIVSATTTTLSVGSSLEAENGLYRSGDMFGLGGSLVRNTSITTGSFRFDVELSSGGGFSVTTSAQVLSVRPEGVVDIGSSVLTDSKLNIRGDVAVNDAHALKLFEPANDGLHSTSFRATSQLGDIEYELPAAIGAVGSVLTIASSSATGAVLSWANASPATGVLSVTAGINNDVPHNGWSYLKVRNDPGGDFSIAGLAPAADGSVLTIYNATPRNMSIPNEALSSTPGGRVNTTHGIGFTTDGRGSVTLVYDGDEQRWIVTSFQP